SVTRWSGVGQASTPLAFRPVSRPSNSSIARRSSRLPEGPCPRRAATTSKESWESGHGVRIISSVKRAAAPSSTLLQNRSRRPNTSGPAPRRAWKAATVAGLKKIACRSSSAARVRRAGTCARAEHRPVAPVRKGPTAIRTSVRQIAAWPTAGWCSDGSEQRAALASVRCRVLSSDPSRVGRRLWSQQLRPEDALARLDQRQAVRCHSLLLYATFHFRMPGRAQPAPLAVTGSAGGWRADHHAPAGGDEAQRGRFSGHHGDPESDQRKPRVAPHVERSRPDGSGGAALGSRRRVVRSASGEVTSDRRSRAPNRSPERETLSSAHSSVL